MTVERTDDEIIIRLSADMNPDRLQQLLDYLTYQQATARSQATQAEVDELAREVNRNWWAENRARFLK